MERINKDIATGQFKRVYLLYGPEDYLKQQCKSRLINALVAPGDNMNYAKVDRENFESDDVMIKAICDMADTMPFFADYRVILIENSGLFSKSCDTLAEYISHIPDYVVMIFVEPAPVTDKDGRVKNSVSKTYKLYKAVDKAGGAFELKTPNEQTLQSWVLGILKKQDLPSTMTRDAWDLFYQRAGENMDTMNNELQKLIMYTSGKDKIEQSDVAAICTVNIETKIFDMLTAMGNRDLKGVMDLYQDMLSAKEPAMRILFMIVRQFRQMLMATELYESNENFGSIAGKIGAPEFVAKNLVRLSKNFSKKEIRRLLEDAAEFEQRVKSGRLDEKLAVELLMAKYCKKNN